MQLISKTNKIPIKFNINLNAVSNSQTGGALSW